MDIDSDIENYTSSVSITSSVPNSPSKRINEVQPCRVLEAISENEKVLI